MRARKAPFGAFLALILILYEAPQALSSLERSEGMTFSRSG
jgi:hypothetical protein